MSKYTTEVRYICEHYAGLDKSSGIGSVDDVISKSREKVFSFGYPIFDEGYRSVLETKILRHFYTREICEETVGLWKLRLENRMNEIMPYYNQLYKSELLEFNPLYDVDITRKRDGKVDGTKDENGTSKGKVDGSTTSKNTVDGTIGVVGSGSDKSSGTSGNTHRDLYSDTPQGALDNLENETYLTNARKVTDDETTGNESSRENKEDTTTNTTDSGSGTSSSESSGESTNKVVSSNTESYLESVSGKNGGSSYSEMLMKYRETFLNIDRQIIDKELGDLFFNLW